MVIRGMRPKQVSVRIRSKKFCESNKKGPTSVRWGIRPSKLRTSFS